MKDFDDHQDIIRRNQKLDELLKSMPEDEATSLRELLAQAPKTKSYSAILEEVESLGPRAPIEYPKLLRLSLACVAIIPLLGIALYAMTDKTDKDTFVLLQLFLWPFGVLFSMCLVTGLYYKTMPDSLFQPDVPISSTFSFCLLAFCYFVGATGFFWAAYDFFVAGY